MKKFLMALAVLALVSAPAFAGPNAGGVLVVHNTGIVYEQGGVDWPSDPPTCDGVVNQADLGADPSLWRVWKVYAAFPITAQPRLKGVVFGLSYPAFGDGYIVVWGAGLPTAGDLEVTQDGWPGDGSSNGIAFLQTKTGIVDECYWFGGYAYSYSGNDPQMFCTAPHSTNLSVFIDDAVPANEDPIAAFGCLGFGQPGVTECPAIPTGACCVGEYQECQILTADECLAGQGNVWVGAETCDPDPCVHPMTGACCLADDTCIVVTAADCEAQGGEYIGDDYPCEADTCVPPVPTQETSWGQIKANFR